jgi:hypothetical protein
MIKGIQPNISFKGIKLQVKEKGNDKIQQIDIPDRGNIFTISQNKEGYKLSARNPVSEVDSDKVYEQIRANKVDDLTGLYVDDAKNITVDKVDNNGIVCGCDNSEITIDEADDARISFDNAKGSVKSMNNSELRAFKSNIEIGKVESRKPTSEFPKSSEIRLESLSSAKIGSFAGELRAESGTKFDINDAEDNSLIELLHNSEGKVKRAKKDSIIKVFHDAKVNVDNLFGKLAAFDNAKAKVKYAEKGSATYVPKAKIDINDDKRAFGISKPSDSDENSVESSKKEFDTQWITDGKSTSTIKISGSNDDYMNLGE